MKKPTSPGETFVAGLRVLSKRLLALRALLASSIPIDSDDDPRHIGNSRKRRPSASIPRTGHLGSSKKKIVHRTQKASCKSSPA